MGQKYKIKIDGTFVAERDYRYLVSTSEGTATEFSYGMMKQIEEKLSYKSFEAISVKGYALLHYIKK